MQTYKNPKLLNTFNSKKIINSITYHFQKYLFIISSHIAVAT